MPAVSGSAEELNRIEEEVAPAAEPSPDPEELIDAAAEAAEELIGRPERIADLTEEELAAVIELGFGLAAEWRGPHWEIEERAARRIAKWLRRSIERHGGVPAWVVKWLPDFFVLALLGSEVWKRVGRDRQLKAELDAGAAGR